MPPKHRMNYVSVDNHILIASQVAVKAESSHVCKRSVKNLRCPVKLIGRNAGAPIALIPNLGGALSAANATWLTLSGAEMGP